MSYVTVSAKIKKRIYEKLKAYNIPISKVIREALEKEVEKREEEELKKLLGEAGNILEKIPEQELVNAIRSTREKL
ncbi:MAG: hypothetical protein B6U94_05155 [Thermofilum sp. ex4484_79]|nr:MAG: hypothetical protein B6U94_05155 [Thermofilum sp. ex4484_79]